MEQDVVLYPSIAPVTQASAYVSPIFPFKLLTQLTTELVTCELYPYYCFNQVPSSLWPFSGLRIYCFLCLEQLSPSPLSQFTFGWLLFPSGLNLKVICSEQSCPRPPLSYLKQPIFVILFIPSCLNLFAFVCLSTPSQAPEGKELYLVLLT